jgi:hypothetical protein
MSGECPLRARKNKKPGFAAKSTGITDMAKDQSRAVRNRLKSVPVAQQATVMYPLVMREPSRPHDHKELSEADFQALESAGGIRFEPDTRRALEGIAAGWMSHDLVLHSPRPRQFRKRLQEMKQAVERTITSLDLNKGDAPILDHHLYNWMNNVGFDGADDLLQSSTILMQEGRKLIDLLQRAQGSLPLDKGRSRPKDDDRFIIFLAIKFEASGGRAVAFKNSHTASGYGDTHFRKFIHKFYQLLPIKSRRTASGLDEAIIRALKYRRSRSEKG